MANYKYFSTYETKMTHTQKKNLFNEVVSSTVNDPFTFKEFFALPGIFEMVSMKCLKCEYEINVSFLYYKPAIDEGVLPFPIEECANCLTNQLVPKEVFIKLNK